MKITLDLDANITILNAREYGFHPYVFRVRFWKRYYFTFVVLKLMGIFKISGEAALYTLCKRVKGGSKNRRELCKRIDKELNLNINWGIFNPYKIPYSGKNLKPKKSVAPSILEEVKKYDSAIKSLASRKAHFSETLEAKAARLAKSKQTRRERYGDENYTNRDKAKSTCRERYGHPWANNPEKSKATCRERYGVDHQMRLPHLRANASRMMKEYKAKNKKPKVEKKVEYPSARRQSLKECLFFDKLEGWVIKPFLMQYQAKVGKYSVDGLIPHKKFVFEFLGDYWHGNPDRYPPWGFNKICGKSFGELYENTFKRFQEIENLGYKVFYIWENDFDLYGVDALKSFSDPHLLEDSLNG